MESREILNFCLKKGILLDTELMDLFKGVKDTEHVKMIIDKVSEETSQKIITKSIIYENKEKVVNLFSEIPSEAKEDFEELTVKLGLRIEISGKKKAQVEESSNEEYENLSGRVRLISPALEQGKTLEVKNFVNYFRNRFSEIRDILKEHAKLTNLTSINKISRDNQRVSVIGIVYDKKITKNKNIILEVEDLTGKISILINHNKPEVYKIAEDVCLDAVLGFNGSGNSDIIFANEIIFPELMNMERKRSPIEEHALFISDIHVGSKNFLEKQFLRLIDYLNGKIPNTPEFDKVKYLFLVGDLIAGVGVYPNQEKELAIKDIEGQYLRLTELLDMIRKDIKIIILPGNHDCVRLMEPQPVLDQKYAWPLFNLENVLLVPNPSMVNIGATKDFPGFNVLAYHGYSYFYYANTVPSLIESDAINTPTKIVEYLLKNRHLAPTHSSVQYFPSEKDNLLIRNVPDIYVSGHIHSNTLGYYNNILMISNSCWETIMPYQEKYGCVTPDYCKVPSFNLKTGQVKILDFYD